MRAKTTKRVYNIFVNQNKGVFMDKYKVVICINDHTGQTRYIKDETCATDWFEACAIFKAKYGMAFRHFSEGPHLCS
jgi:hypothetical protein